MKKTRINKPNLIVVCGPTASGKTAIGIELAQWLKTEIISADSRQFYKEIPIGTAQPSIKELRKVQHHFVANCELEQDLNAGEFEKKSLLLLDLLFQKHKNVLLVGGSGLFISAVCEGFHELPPADLELRDKLDLLFKNEGIESISNLLKKLDPEKYILIDLKNPQRIIRAIEIIECGKKSFNNQVAHKLPIRSFNTLKIGLNFSRDELYERINCRVDEMISNGLEDECRKVFEKRNLNALKTVGYKEFFEFFDDKIDYESCVNKIKQNTRRYAKRQLTWFNKDKTIKWFSPNEIDRIKEYIFANINYD